MKNKKGLNILETKEVLTLDEMLDKKINVSLFEKFISMTKEHNNLTPSVLRDIAFKTVYQGLKEDILQYTKEDKSKIVSIQVDLWNYMNLTHKEYLEEIHSILDEGMYTYFIFIEPIQKLMKNKRLYTNKYKGFRVFNAEDHENGKYILTRLSAEKLELVLMFVEGLFGKELSLDKLIFYTTLFFDVYEIPNMEYTNFGEKKLEELDISTVKVYSTCIQAIRGRHSSHKELLLQSQLLWENMTFDDRIYRVLRYHEDKFSLVFDKEEEKNGTVYVEKVYQLSFENSLLKDNKYLDIDVAFLEEKNGDCIEVNIKFNVDIYDFENVEFKLELEGENQFSLIDYTKYEDCSSDNKGAPVSVGYKFQPYFS